MFIRMCIRISFSTYASQIQRYDSADNFNTEHSEIAHKHLIKIFFDCINKQETFQRQLLLKFQM